MKSIGATRTLLLSVLAGAGITAAALLFGPGIVSAEDPTPTPAAGQQQTMPATPGGRLGTHAPGDCPNMGSDSGSAPSSSSGSDANGGVGFQTQQRGPRA